MSELEDPIRALARARGVDPEELRAEVSDFRHALDADRAAAAGARRRLPRRRLAAVAVAAGLAGMAGGAAITAAAAGATGRTPAAVHPVATGSPARVLAASQAGTLSYAAEHRLPAATIVAAADALHASLVPLMDEAQRDSALAAQLRSLLVAARAALSSVPSPDAQVLSAIRSTDSLIGGLPAVPAGGPPATAPATGVLAPAADGTATMPAPARPTGGGALASAVPVAPPRVPPSAPLSAAPVATPVG